MAENSKIEWTDHTFNPWIGCTKVSPGCDNCYAEAREDKRLHRVQWGAGQPRHRTKTWSDPVKWNKAHAAFFAEHGRRQRVFCASLADVFDNEVVDDWRVDLFRLIAATPNLDWLVLTKRIGSARRMLKTVIDSLNRESDAHPYWPWPNVWLGATIVNQEEADRDIPKLLATPARLRFLSMEPLLGPVSFEGLWVEHADPAIHENVLEALDLVIAGGESGHKAQPSHPDWFRSLRDQCARFDVPFFFKQWGEWLPCETDCGGNGDAWGVADDGSDRELSGRSIAITTMPDRQQMAKVGKKAAGRLLDGRTHDEFPEVAKT